MGMMASEAPVWIVVCLDTPGMDVQGAAPPGRSAGASIYPAVQNMLLPVGTGRYSVEQPHQSEIWSVWGGAQPCGRRSAARNRIEATSRPQVQQASVGWRRPRVSSQVGGVTEPDSRVT